MVKCYYNAENVFYLLWLLGLVQKSDRQNVLHEARCTITTLCSCHFVASILYRRKNLAASGTASSSKGLLNIGLFNKFVAFFQSTNFSHRIEAVQHYLCCSLLSSCSADSRTVWRLSSWKRASSRPSSKSTGHPDRGASLRPK